MGIAIKAWRWKDMNRVSKASRSAGLMWLLTYAARYYYDFNDIRLDEAKNSNHL